LSVELQPQIRGWLLASVDGTKTGILPANHIKLLGRKRGSRHTAPTTTTPTSVPLSSSAPAVLPSNPSQTFQPLETSNSAQPVHVPGLQDFIVADLGRRNNPMVAPNLVADLDLVDEYHRDSS